jgi:hypothetical protein
VTITRLQDFMSQTGLEMVYNHLKKRMRSLWSRHNDDDVEHQHIPSDTIPSNIPSSIPRNILAFRTITMMLAKLQPKQSFITEGDAYEVSAGARREVRIFNALAHLATIDNDVVALTTKYTSDGITVLACVSIPEDPPKKPPQPEGFIDQIISFVLMKNPCKDDPSTSTVTDPIVTYPNIISATQPEDMGSQTLNDYIENLDGRS